MPRCNTSTPVTMRRRPGSPLLPALAAATLLASAALLIPAQASAQAPADPNQPSLPPADAFDIRYFLTDEKGNRVRPMDAQDFSFFVNKARCQCGSRIETQVRLKITQGNTYSLGEQMVAYVGPNCAMAEVTPFGQFKQCVQTVGATVSGYVQGFNTKVHPLWLSSGVTADSTRPIDSPNTIAAFSCEEEAFGQSGVWICAPNSNKTGGCQAEDFFINANVNSNLGNSNGIAYDFQPPTTELESVSAEPGDSAVVVSWEVPGQAGSGDIFGFRVLCEEADTGKPPPGKGMKAPALDARSFGTYYYTKDNLCPDGPFAEVNVSPEPPSVSTSATTTDTDGVDTDAGTGGLDTGGLDTDTDTDTDGAPVARCGDGQLAADTEQCDDGNFIDHDDCRNDCTVATCGDGVRSVGTTVMEACDLGVNNGPTTLCLDGCVLAPPPVCGDGNIQIGETCDPIVAGCTDCTVDTCGDGMVQLPETCDAPGQPECSPRCTNTACGDGLLSPEELCDNGANNSDAAACTSACVPATCGDGLVRSDETDPTLIEECDDGPDNGDDKACLPTCIRNACGDGKLGPDEQCDDGAANNGDDKACLSNCIANSCGDGKLGPSEACDNGADNGDDKLCRADCTRQSSVGMEKLDWAYVCSDHLSQQTRSVRIEGLENDKRYNFLVVTYDQAGNPRAFNTVVNSTPLDTRDLWEQCKAQGDVCGESGFCNVAGRSDDLLALGGLLGLGLGLGGLLRRSRRKSA